MASWKPSINASKIWTFFAIVNFLSVPQLRLVERLSVFRLGLPVRLCRREKAGRFRRRVPKNNTYIASRLACPSLSRDSPHVLCGYRPTPEQSFPATGCRADLLEWHGAQSQPLLSPAGGASQ